MSTGPILAFFSAGRVGRWPFGRLLLTWFGATVFALGTMFAAGKHADTVGTRYATDTRGCLVNLETGEPLNQLACTLVQQARAARSPAHAIAWGTFFVGLVVIPLGLIPLTIRWLSATRDFASGSGVRTWHPSKLAMLWLVLAGGTAATASLFEYASERVAVVGVAALFGFPLFIITWEWLTGVRRL